MCAARPNIFMIVMLNKILLCPCYQVTKITFCGRKTQTPLSDIQHSTQTQKITQVALQGWDVIKTIWGLLILQFLIHHSFDLIPWIKVSQCRTHLDPVRPHALSFTIWINSYWLACGTVAHLPTSSKVSLAVRPFVPNPWRALGVNLPNSVLSAVIPSCLGEHALKPVATWELSSYGGHSFY